MSIELASRVSEIPGDGWYRRDNETAFVDLAHDLAARGLSDDEVVDVLTRAYSAVASEYGE